MPSSQVRPLGVPSTAEMLEMLDQVTQDIPRLLESLGNAIGTLVNRNTDPAKVDVWEKNLRGYSGQYYGRLTTCQNALRTVIRHLHTLRVDPHTIRPPTSNIPPLAFALPGPDKPYAPPTASSQEVTVNDIAPQTDISTPDNGLSLYAARLELKALQDMHTALQRMMDENVQDPTEENPESVAESQSIASVGTHTANKQSPTPYQSATTPLAHTLPEVTATTTMSETLQLNETTNGHENGTKPGITGLAAYADSDESDVNMEDGPD